MAEEKKGRLTQIVGAVLDVKFEDSLPEINEAIRIKRQDGTNLVVEVAQHLGNDTVRCVAMGPTDGLVRGMDAIATGSPIKVPVGEKTLGRIFNVLGEPIDNKPAPEDVDYEPIHRAAPAFKEQSTEQEMLETEDIITPNSITQLGRWHIIRLLKVAQLLYTMLPLPRRSLPTIPLLLLFP